MPLRRRFPEGVPNYVTEAKCYMLATCMYYVYVYYTTPAALHYSTSHDRVVGGLASGGRTAGGRHVGTVGGRGIGEILLL